MSIRPHYLSRTLFYIVNVSDSQAGAAYKYVLVSQPLAFFFPPLLRQPFSLRASSSVPFHSSVLCLKLLPFLLRRQRQLTQKTIPAIAKRRLSRKRRLVPFHSCELYRFISSSCLFWSLRPMVTFWLTIGLPFNVLHFRNQPMFVRLTILLDQSVIRFYDSVRTLSSSPPPLSLQTYPVWHVHVGTVSISL